MDIDFSSSKLRKVCNSEKDARKYFGVQQGAKVMQRLGELAAANSLEELRNVPGHYHELREDRKGQLACHLIQPERLVFAPNHDPRPLRADGSLDWSRVTAVVIIEVIDYHK